MYYDSFVPTASFCYKRSWKTPSTWLEFAQIDMLWRWLGYGDSTVVHYWFPQEIIPPSLAHVSRVSPSHIFNSVVFVADQLRVRSHERQSSVKTSSVHMTFHFGLRGCLLLATISHINYWDQLNSWKNFWKIWNGPLCRNKSGASPPLNVVVYWQGSNTKTGAKKLSQILANNIDKGGRGIGLRIYVRYCRCLTNEGGSRGQRGNNKNNHSIYSW